MDVRKQSPPTQEKCRKPFPPRSPLRHRHRQFDSPSIQLSDFDNVVSKRLHSYSDGIFTRIAADTSRGARKQLPLQNGVTEASSKGSPAAYCATRSTELFEMAPSPVPLISGQRERGLLDM